MAMNDPVDTLDPGQGKLVEFRVQAILGAAWDAAPLELPSADASVLTLNFSYTRAGAGGAFDFQIWTSIYSVVGLVPGGAQEWCCETLYQAAIVAAGVNANSRFQRELFTYQAGGAGTEGVSYGPLRLDGTIERIRVRARESGTPQEPGELQIQGVLR